MNPLAPHAGHADRQARKQHLDALIGASGMRTVPAMRSLGREVFADGALAKKHKELTALAVAVVDNCWE